MEALKKILGTFCISAFLTSIAHASWLSDFISKNFDSSITSESAGYHKTQASGFVTGGSTRIRWANAGSIRPFSVQAPKLNVGCNGIDFTFGSFSYLGFDEIVKKLKKISASAPAFAFQIALSTLCKDCQAILGELENVANMINNINFDTCAMTTNLAKNIGNALNDKLSDGKEDSWNSSFSKYVSKAGNKIQEWSSEINSGFKSVFGDGTDSPSNIKRSQGSLIKNVIASQTKTNNSSQSFLNMFGKDNYEIIMRALFGDIFGFTQDGIDDIAVVSATLPAEEFMKAVWSDDSNNVKLNFFSQTINCNEDEGCPANQISARDETIDVISLKSQYRSKLEKIVDEMQKGSVSANSLKEIEKAPIAVADLLNLASTGEIELDDNLIDFISLEVFKAYIQELMFDIEKHLGYVWTSKRMKQTDAHEKVDVVYSIFNQNRQSIYTRINDYLKTNAEKLSDVSAALDYTSRYISKSFEINKLSKKNKT